MKAEGGGSGGSSKVGQMGAEARVDDQLLLLAGDGELEEELGGRDVVDVGQAEADQGLKQFMGSDLVGGMNKAIVSMGTDSMRRVLAWKTPIIDHTLTSRDEKRCFMMDTESARCRP